MILLRDGLQITFKESAAGLWWASLEFTYDGRRIIERHDATKAEALDRIAETLNYWRNMVLTEKTNLPQNPSAASAPPRET